MSLVAVAAVAAVVPATIAFAADPPPTATASVVKVENKKAHRTKVVQRKFIPWAKPSPSLVRKIVASEARRWNVSAAALSRRVACESHYRWWASNGQYSGVLQFAPTTFSRGMRTIKTRQVRFVSTKSRRVHDQRVTHYSDGRIESRRTTPRRQRVLVVYKGRLPRRPAVNHTFAQVRIGAQALRGISAVRSSEWACGA